MCYAKCTVGKAAVFITLESDICICFCLVRHAIKGHEETIMNTFLIYVENIHIASDNTMTENNIAVSYTGGYATMRA